MQAASIAALLILTAPLAAHAQRENSAVPEIPLEESPFFVLDEEAAETRDNAVASASRSYPQNKNSEASATKMLTSFFTEMFASVNLSSKEGRSGSKLEVEPKSFSVDERREIAVTYTVFNKTGDLLKLDFPTSQRIEILVRDPDGKIIERWSDDRAFQDVSGIVMINPGERIQYLEKIATREMVLGKKYTIEASLANNTEFTKTTDITPTGKPRDLKPPPGLTEPSTTEGADGSSQDG